MYLLKFISNEFLWTLDILGIYIKLIRFTETNLFHALETQTLE